MSLRVGGETWPIASLRYDGAARSTTAWSSGGGCIATTTEHLFAALAGASVHAGVVVELEGRELPIADGAAATFFDALMKLGARPSEPALVIARAGTVAHGESRYVFTPGDDVEVDVVVELGDARLASEARWQGDPGDFRARIAPARTFAREEDVEELARRGLGRHVPPESVVVLTADRILFAGAPFTPDEPARHKLLDLIGDLYAYGGPPPGRVHAHRPGHAATHAIVARALEEGILARVEDRFTDSLAATRSTRR